MPTLISISRSRRRLAVPMLLLVLFPLLALWLALHSSGVQMDDDVLHFLVARSSWNDPTLLLHIWGRPGFTVPHALVAWIGSMWAGLMASRLLTLAAAASAGMFAYLTARRLRAPCAAAVPLVWWMMPFVFKQSFTPHTEMMAALYIAAGTWLLATGRRRWAAAVFALLGATRHELIVFLAPLGLYFLYGRDWIAVLLLTWAELLWNAASILSHQPIPIRRFFETTDPGHLGTGDALHFFNRWVEMAGIPTVGLTLAGAYIIFAHQIRRIARSRRRTVKLARRDRIRLFIAGGAVGLVALHTLLYMFNRFASGGYARFVLPAGPWMAIVAAYPLGLLLHRQRRYVWVLLPAAVSVIGIYSEDWLHLRNELRLIPLFAAIPVLLLPSRATVVLLLAVHFSLAGLQWSLSWGPHTLAPDQQLIADTLKDLRRQYPDYRIVGPSPWVWFFQEEPLDSRFPPPWDRWRTANPPKLLYLWDAVHGNDRFPLQELEQYPHQLIHEAWLIDDPDVETDAPALWVFRRLPDR